MNVMKMQKEIDEKYKRFIEKYNREPEIANCRIEWKDNNDSYEVKIQLSADSNPNEDDDTFFYCDSLNDLKSLVTSGVEDFIVTECCSFE